MGTKLKVSQNCDLAIQKAKGVLSCTGQSSSRSREAILPLCSAPEGLCPVLGLPSTAEMEETEPAFSQWCPIPNRQQVQTKTQGNPFKPKLFCFGFLLLLFFYLWLTSINTGAGCLDGLPPSLEIFKTQMDTAPNTPCWLTGLDEVWTRWSSEVFASLSDFLLPSQGTYKHRKSPPISVDHQTQQSSVV